VATTDGVSRRPDEPHGHDGRGVALAVISRMVTMAGVSRQP
jgi:hypothetical protein